MRHSWKAIHKFDNEHKAILEQKIVNILCSTCYDSRCDTYLYSSPPKRLKRCKGLRSNTNRILLLIRREIDYASSTRD